MLSLKFFEFLARSRRGYQEGSVHIVSLGSDVWGVVLGEMEISSRSGRVWGCRVILSGERAGLKGERAGLRIPGLPLALCRAERSEKHSEHSG